MPKCFRLCTREIWGTPQGPSLCKREVLCIVIAMHCCCKGLSGTDVVWDRLESEQQRSESWSGMDMAGPGSFATLGGLVQAGCAASLSQHMVYMSCREFLGTLYSSACATQVWGSLRQPQEVTSVSSNPLSLVFIPSVQEGEITKSSMGVQKG